MEASREKEGAGATARPQALDGEEGGGGRYTYWSHSIKHPLLLVSVLCAQTNSRVWCCVRLGVAAAVLGRGVVVAARAPVHCPSTEIWPASATWWWRRAAGRWWAFARPSSRCVCVWGGGSTEGVGRQG